MDINRFSETDYHTIFKDISLRYNIPFPIIEKICMSQFGMLRDTMKEGIKNDENSFKNVRLLGLGLFYSSPRLIKRMKELNNKKHEGTTEGS